MNSDDDRAAASASDPAEATSPHGNRREHERHKLEAEIGVYSESNFYTGFSQDISEGGMFVATYELRPIGALVELEFGLPGGREMKVSGEVRWVKDPVDSDSSPGMGVQFRNLTAEDLVAIQEFISNREPLFHDDE